MAQFLATRLKKIRSNLQIVRTIRLSISASQKWSFLNILFITLESVLFFLTLYSLKLLINEISSLNPELWQYLFLAGGIAVIHAMIKSISTYITEVQSAGLSEFINDKIHAKASTLNLSFYEDPDYFDILKRARDAGPERPQSIVRNLSDIAKNILSLIAIGLILSTMDLWLLPLLILFVLPTLYIRIHYAEKLHEQRKKRTALDRQSAYYSSLLTSDLSAKEIRTFGLSDFFRRKYSDIRKLVLNEKFQILRKSSFSEGGSTILATIGFFVAIGYIAFGITNNRTTIGDITVFLVVFPQCFFLLQGLSKGISSLYHNSIYISDIFHLIDLPSEDISREQGPLINKEVPISLDIQNISFRYPHSKELVLKNISMKIESGKIIAVVGLNGAGKSTLLKLLNRLYEPLEGQILLNGVDISHFNIQEYRKEISTIFQDFGKYHTTASDNIRFGNINAEGQEKDIINAAKDSGADQFIQNFPLKYETMMGRSFEGGHEVSIGQWQKLAIARALYSSGRILIMDEATSALDALSERRLFNNFREKIGRRAALIVSHRISAVEHADYVYVLSEGRVSQQGTHAELISREGEYAEIFKKPAISEKN